MIINNKYIIGTHIMFYEIEMIREQTESLVNAIATVDNPENITIDYFFNMSEYFEKIDRSQISEQRLIELFHDEINKLQATGCNVTYTIYSELAPITMVDYRRDLNYFNCTKYDYVIWGESDCLLPKEMFMALEQIKSYANEAGINKFVTTFAIRKMWDDQWKDLEHPEFTNAPYYEDERAFLYPHSIRYTMSNDEMNELNAKSESFDVRVINRPKFDGSCLILSSDLLKNGINIPHCMIGHLHEDTSMMVACQHMMGQNYIQFVVKNILKVHNRNHPKKRLYALDMDSNAPLSDFSKGGKKGKWFDKMRKLVDFNIGNYGPSQAKFNTYTNFENKMKE
jgi:hypothetical protein